MGRIGPNEVRGGPNRVSAQRRRRLCRALRGALCGGLREGVHEVVWGCAEASSVLEKGGLQDDCGGSVAAGSVAAGGLSGWRADGVAGRRGARVVVVVSCGWPLAGLLRDCCGRLAGCGGSRVQAGAAVAGTCCGRLAALGEECSGGEMRGDCRFCRGMGRRMDVEELTGRRGVSVPGGRAIGMESRRGTAAERAVVMKGRGSGRGGCREPTAGIAVWMVWGGRGRATVGSCGPLPRVMAGSFCWKEDPAAVCPFIGRGPLQRCWQAFLGLNNPLPRCGAGFSRTGGNVPWRGLRYRSAAVSCAQR